MIAATSPVKMGTATYRIDLSRTPNVLLVNFDKAETARFTRYLEDAYRLQTVKTERQLMSMLEAQPMPVIIINTVSGSAQEGIQICSRLKSTPRFSHLILILVVAANDHAARISCLESGADAWMEQPLSRDYLRALLRNLLANRRRIKSHFGPSTLFAADPMPSTPGNQSFLGRLNKIIADHLADIDLNVDVMARLMNISRPTLYRKTKYISDRTPNGLVNDIRLNKAAELLATSDNKVFEIARCVGFHSRSNFGKAFVKHFGIAPLEYRHRVFHTQK